MQSLYSRIQSLPDLEKALGSTETFELDFKTRVDPKEWWELAKDIAAFANCVGGVLLIGVAEDNAGKARLTGIEHHEAAVLRDAYEKAARDKCLPRPLVTTAVLNLAGGSDRCVLAVNVEPVPDQIVGAMFFATNSGGKPTTSDAWRFPIRVGKDNVAITPDRLPMFIDAKVRRAAIRLSAIPVGASPLLVWRRPDNQFDVSPVAEAIVGLEVDLSANVFRARRVMNPQQLAFSVPLDDVEAVWEATETNWRIRVTGWLNEQSAYVTNPSNAVFRR